MDKHQLNKLNTVIQTYKNSIIMRYIESNCAGHVPSSIPYNRGTYSWRPYCETCVKRHCLDNHGITNITASDFIILCIADYKLLSGTET